MKYCPYCGSPLMRLPVSGRERLPCPDGQCGFVHWDNPVPVVAAIVEHDDHVVLVRNVGWPQHWYGLVTGFLESGEMPEEGIAREIEEEIGIRIEEVPERLFKLTASVLTGMEFCWVYRLVTDLTLEPDYGEMEAGNWFAVEEVDDWLARAPGEFADSFLLIWSRFRQREDLAPQI